MGLLDRLFRKLGETRQECLLVQDNVPGFGPIGKERLHSIAEDAMHAITYRYGTKIKKFEVVVAFDVGKIILHIHAGTITEHEASEILNYAAICLEKHR
jgi:hypothetical protein